MNDLTKKVLSDITVHGKYSRYVPDLNRRETWDEICDRNCAMHLQKFPQLRAEIQYVYNQFVRPKKVLPSMRSAQFAGRPIEITPSRIFNCAFLPVESPDAFSETMFLLLGGSGVGYSVQHHHVDQLPDVVGPAPGASRRFLVADTIEGWADAIKVLMEAYFHGKPAPLFDLSDIRPKGARLVTSGGKAPGPEPLRNCLAKVQHVLDRCLSEWQEHADLNARLTTLDVHDIQCHIADAVRAGGIRRAAMIALFDRKDRLMLKAKGNFTCSFEKIEARGDGSYDVDIVTRWGDRHYSMVLNEGLVKQQQATGKLPWYLFEPQRGRANNSAVLPRGEVTITEWQQLWQTIRNSGCGEPGIYWTNNINWGTNPCVEIGLKPYQFCNLTTINAATVVDQDDLNQRAEAAAFIGTLQAAYTDFHYLRPIWKQTTEEDALLGVSMTGIASGAVDKLDLQEAASHARMANYMTADIIGINVAHRVTCIKPEGTTSLTVGSSSGVHAYHAPYYIRRMGFDKNEALYQYLAKKVPGLMADDHFRPHTSAFLEMPQKAPEGAAVRTESALTLLDRVLRFSLDWVQPGHVQGDNKHNVSCTISIRDYEWGEVGNWMWINREHYTGISVLPYDGGTYVQAPFEDITEEEFHRRAALVADIDLTEVLETEDNTALTEQAACAGGACEVT